MKSRQRSSVATVRGYVPVLVTDGQGHALDAAFSVEQDGNVLGLILESASGPAGSRPARNTDYRRALTTLLGKLRELDAILQDGLVDSSSTRRRGIPEAERRLFMSPIRLADESDIEALRLRLTSAQSRIGQAPGSSKGGNSSKRIRLRLVVPGYSPEDAIRLEAKLGIHPSARFLSSSLSAEVKQVEESVAQAAGKPTRRGRGQGFQNDQAVKVAVEVCAMKAASEYYGKDWDVEDVHGNQSYDLICRRAGQEKHVEVKGTTTGGIEVILTPSEVRHAREYPCIALFVLSDIVVEHAEDGTVIATGGYKHIYDPWLIDDGTLVPLGFRYLVPDDRSSSLPRYVVNP